MQRHFQGFSCQRFAQEDLLIKWIGVYQRRCGNFIFCTSHRTGIRVRIFGIRVWRCGGFLRNTDGVCLLVAIFSNDGVGDILQRKLLLVTPLIWRKSPTNTPAPFDGSKVVTNLDDIDGIWYAQLDSLPLYLSGRWQYPVAGR